MEADTTKIMHGTLYPHDMQSMDKTQLRAYTIVGRQQYYSWFTNF